MLPAGELARVDHLTAHEPEPPSVPIEPEQPPGPPAEPLEPVERRRRAVELHERGRSLRAIAEQLGSSKDTIRRDLAAAEEEH